MAIGDVDVTWVIGSWPVSELSVWGAANAKADAPDKSVSARAKFAANFLIGVKYKKKAMFFNNAICAPTGADPDFV